MQKHTLTTKESLHFLAFDGTALETLQKRVGTVTEFDSPHTLLPNIVKNKGKFRASALSRKDRQPLNSLPFWNDEEPGFIIEHLPTQTLYAVIPSYGILTVYDYSVLLNGTINSVKTDIDDKWEEISPEHKGTRHGGTTKFSIDAWPHYRGVPLKFIAQHMLPNGKLISIFVDVDNFSNAWRMEDGANCAIIEGGKTPSWITLESVRDDAEEKLNPEFYAQSFCCNPKKAFRLKASDEKMEPRWVQEEYLPEEFGYEYILQFGYSTVATKVQEDKTLWDFSLCDCGDMYVFYNETTEEARVHLQSC